MPIKRTAPVSTQQELQISSQVTYRYKPTANTPPGMPPKKFEPTPIAQFLKADLMRTALTTALILGIVLVVMWRGWLK